MMPTMMRVGGGMLAVEPQHGRNNKLHRLKTLTHFYSAVLIGLKPFEVRFNDRDFQTGDFLLLQEYDPNTETYGRETMRQITYVFEGGAQPSTDKAAVEHVITKGWVVMGMAEVPEAKRQELYDTIEVWNLSASCLRIGDLWDKFDGDGPEAGYYWITDIAGDRRSIKVERQEGEKGGAEFWVQIDKMRPADGWAVKKRGGGI